LVTGADGFVGARLVERLRHDGHEVIAAVRPDRPLFAEGIPAPWGAGVTTVPFELLDGHSVRGIVAVGFDAVVHLAAVASGGDARRDPTDAWQINAVGTARLAEELGRARAGGQTKPVLLVVSTAEVYGAGEARPRLETDPVEPCSPYADSKLGGENAALEVQRRTGLNVVVARAFPHTGRGQDQRFVVPAFARRLVEAKRAGRRQIAVGNLDPVREFLHVADVVEAYVQLMRFGLPGEIYNVAGGEAMSLRELFERLARIVGHAAEPVPDPDLVRDADIPHLVGDSAKLRELTGWTPTHSLDDALTEVVHAEAD
jgi:GDP-4-dehydro-6-deoxy-D-mannose reductase